MLQIVLITGISFFLGGIGFILINKKLDKEKRKANWIKYFAYLIIVICVIGSIFLNRKIFIALIIVINSLGILEMMRVARNINNDESNHKVALVSQFVYLAILLLFLEFALLPQLLIAFTYTVVMLFDAASQITGQLAGRIRIAPKISPNKTLAGFIGGFVFALICAALLHGSVSFSLIKSILYGTIICASAFTGDLLASWYKRKCGVKNFSNILPGQGGIFDRFDSFLAAGSVIGILNIKYLLLNPPDKDLVIYLSISFLFLFVLLSGEVIHFRLNVKSEYSRMIAHFSAGVICLFLLPRLSSPVYVLALCIQSAAFLYLSRKWDLFASHNKVIRKTYGSPLFFAGIMLSFLSYLQMRDIAYFVLPVTVLTFSDPLAALAGMNIKNGKTIKLFKLNISGKTYPGSFIFFISSFLIFFIGLPYYSNPDPLLKVFIALALSFAAAFTEAISSYGTDNITVPLVILVLFFIARSVIL